MCALFSPPTRLAKCDAGECGAGKEWKTHTRSSWEIDGHLRLHEGTMERGLKLYALTSCDSDAAALGEVEGRKGGREGGGIICSSWLFLLLLSPPLNIRED